MHKIMKNNDNMFQGPFILNLSKNARQGQSPRTDTMPIGQKSRASFDKLRVNGCRSGFRRDSPMFAG